jgi:6-phosphogluconolactonase
MKLFFYTVSISVMLLSSCKNESDHDSASKYGFYVGTYTQKEGHVDGKGEGVYEIVIDIDNDSMHVVRTIPDFVNPSFLALSNNQKHLYVVNELGPNSNNYTARLSHISIDSTGKHRKAQESGTYGNAACHVSLNASNNFIAVCNYLGGELAYGQIGNNGNVVGEIRHLVFDCKSANVSRQEASHLHMSAFTSDGTKLITVDLGCDSIRVFAIDYAKGTLNKKSAFGVKPGDGPRHFVLSNDEKILYVVNELTNSVSSYQFDAASGAINYVTSASTLPKEYAEANFTADIHISKDNKILYVSNRGHNSIAAFQLDGKGDMVLLDLTATGGKTPRNFTLTKDGKYLFVANQDSDSIVAFAIQKDGKLIKKGEYAVKTPVCLIEKKL